MGFILNRSAGYRYCGLLVWPLPSQLPPTGATQPCFLLAALFAGIALNVLLYVPNLETQRSLMIFVVFDPLLLSLALGFMRLAGFWQS